MAESAAAIHHVSQCRQKAPLVVIMPDDVSSCIAATGDVMDHAGEVEAKEASHDP